MPSLKTSSPAMMHYDGNLFCVALVHDYGEIITGLAVPKTAGGKNFSLPYLNLKLRDLEKVNGEGYKLTINNLVEIIPSKVILKFAEDVREQISQHRQKVRKERRKNR